MPMQNTRNIDRQRYILYCYIDLVYPGRPSWVRSLIETGLMWTKSVVTLIEISSTEFKYSLLWTRIKYQKQLHDYIFV